MGFGLALPVGRYDDPLRYHREYYRNIHRPRRLRPSTLELPQWAGWECAMAYKMWTKIGKRCRLYKQFHWSSYCRLWLLWCDVLLSPCLLNIPLLPAHRAGVYFAFYVSDVLYWSRTELSFRTFDRRIAVVGCPLSSFIIFTAKDIWTNTRSTIRCTGNRSTVAVGWLLSGAPKYVRTLRLNIPSLFHCFLSLEMTINGKWCTPIASCHAKNFGRVHDTTVSAAFYF